MIIYQVFTRLFGNRNTQLTPNGSLAQNGSGKMADFTLQVLRQIRQMGCTHVWYTGVIRHATQTDYTAYGIPRQHPEVVKGRAGSPYAITDYYDIDPDLAVKVPRRMREFEELVARTHQAGMKVIIDFVPNHVAREYHSICRPEGGRDLGEDDDTTKHFSTANNFYYCDTALDLTDVLGSSTAATYAEMPARATGNDQFSPRPTPNDWYETVKLNYGIDYCDCGGRSQHFAPTPDTWLKMTHILLFWAAKGIDGFRCDMAEMVPPEFWHYATQKVREQYPDIDFIGEVYDPNRYRAYLQAGFSYLYDKVGMYDCLRDVACGRRWASDITRQWQQTDDIAPHMLYFLENHDEQRIASTFFATDPRRALPAHLVSCMLRANPYMLYMGQELGERGMDEEGFSGRDGRTTIFDYWALPTLRRCFYEKDALTPDEQALRRSYVQIMLTAEQEKAIRSGAMYDLQYVNMHLLEHQYAFLRKADDELLLIVANFADEAVATTVTVPRHAFDHLGIQAATGTATELLSGSRRHIDLRPDEPLDIDLPALGGVVWKIKTSTKKDMEEPVFNEHNKEEYPPSHTAEHLLNQLMGRMFGCKRSTNAHIERKKSKISYVLDHKPDRREEKAIEQEMNRLIALDMPVTYEMVDRLHVPEGVDLGRLPEDASETLRIVRIGDYDVCACLGKHVRSTAQIGRFEMLGTNWDEASHTFRIRFKIV